MSFLCASGSASVRGVIDDEKNFLIELSMAVPMG
jgi:hypothetical protein